MGVELGKQLANRICRSWAMIKLLSSHDSSTNGLINRHKAEPDGAALIRSTYRIASVVSRVRRFAAIRVKENKIARAH